MWVEFPSMVGKILDCLQVTGNGGQVFLSGFLCWLVNFALITFIYNKATLWYDIIFTAINNVKLKYLKKQNRTHLKLNLVGTNLVPEVWILTRLAQSTTLFPHPTTASLKACRCLSSVESSDGHGMMSASVNCSGPNSAVSSSSTFNSVSQSVSLRPTSKPASDE